MTRKLSCGHEHTEAEILSTAHSIWSRRRTAPRTGRKPKPSACPVCGQVHPSAAAAKACCKPRARVYAIPSAVIKLRVVVDEPTHRRWVLSRELQRPLARQFVVASFCTDVRLSEVCFAELAPAAAEFERRVMVNR